MAFYTYQHSTDDGRVFYIGKGKKRRAWATKYRSKWWEKTAAKHGLNVSILAHWRTEHEAFEHERTLIRTFRELGHPLVNLTDGGEGFAGGKHSQEWRERISAMFKGRPGKPMPQEQRERLRAYLKANPPITFLGKKHKAESIAKRSAVRRANAPKFAADGISMSASEWAASLGLHISTIHYRIKTGKLVRVEA
jgi:hypothetical protein